MYAINTGAFGDFGRFTKVTDNKAGLVETLIFYGADVNAKSEQSPREEDHSFGNTPLHYATIIVNPRDSIDMIEYLVRKGADVNARNNLLETPLMWSLQAAIDDNREKLFIEMITHLADVNLQTNIGNSYLHLVIYNKDINLIQKLMKKFGSMFDLHLKNREGLTPLEFAKHTMQPESVRAIESFKPLGHNDRVDVRDELGRTPLMLAIIRNDLVFAQRQFDLGAKTNVHDTTQYENYPLHFAVIRHYTVEPFVTLLLNNKADANVQNAYGDTPLHYLVTYNIKSPERNAIAKLLIDKGANPTIANNKGDTAVDIARRLDTAFANKLEHLFSERNKQKTK
jgi:ankyrin repeat protein